MFDINKVYIAADEIVEEMLSASDIWKMCYPCHRKGKCCVNADIDAYPCELEIIKKRIDSDQDLYKKILSSVQSKSKCIFYDENASSCLIFDIRPLICRLTPFWVRTDDKGRTFYNKIISENCDFKKEIVTPENPIDRGLFIDEVPYLFLNKFEEMVPEKRISAFDFFAGYFETHSCG